MKKISSHKIISGLLVMLLAIAAVCTANGGIRNTSCQLGSRLDDVIRDEDTPPYLSLHYRVRHCYFALPLHRSHPIVFLGDSMTDRGDWSQLYPQVNLVNRGIGGDTTLGLLQRLNQVIQLAPPKIFLMIGTNDLCYNRSIEDALDNYDKILGILHANLPDTKIYVESVLPFNDTLFPSNCLRTNENILRLNQGIRQLAYKFNDPYIDLVPDFQDSNGRLLAEYTVDGLHLNDTGYALWRDRLAPYVKE